MPSRPGSIQSNTTRSNDSAFRRKNPSSPVWAVTAEKPPFSRPDAIARAVFSSSSIIKRRIRQFPDSHDARSFLGARAATDRATRLMGELISKLRFDAAGAHDTPAAHRFVEGESARGEKRHTQPRVTPRNQQPREDQGEAPHRSHDPSAPVDIACK